MKLHEVVLLWMGFVSILTFAGTLFTIPLLLVRIPEDYFTRTAGPHNRRQYRHPAIRIFVLVIKNLLGILFIAGGIAMLFLPGQGILTILIGIILTNFPGKPALERWLIRHSAVYHPVNRLRRWAHHPPLQIPHRDKK
ncbi:MAG: hypothetical protein GXP58_03875 [Deltaproteobacteria bacterium]|nr:hypothetical protein [Deltaproteobacteria bacterium]